MDAGHSGTGGAVMAVPSARPLIAQDLRASQVGIAYREPKEPALRPIYERLKTRQVLEDLQCRP